MQTTYENLQFLGTVYDWRAIAAIFALLLVLDMTLKAVAMWRAAVMKRPVWFIALFLINSMGILPLAFLQMTKKQYQDLRVDSSSEVTP